MPQISEKTQLIHARIDPKLKASAEKVFSKIGIRQPRPFGSSCGKSNCTRDFHLRSRFLTWKPQPRWRRRTTRRR